MTELRNRGSTTNSKTWGRAIARGIAVSLLVAFLLSPVFEVLFPALRDPQNSARSAVVGIGVWAIAAITGAWQVCRHRPQAR